MILQDDFKPITAANLVGDINDETKPVWVRALMAEADAYNSEKVKLEGSQAGDGRVTIPEANQLFHLIETDDISPLFEDEKDTSMKAFIQKALQSRKVNNELDKSEALLGLSYFHKKLVLKNRSPEMAAKQKQRDAYLAQIDKFYAQGNAEAIRAINLKIDPLEEEILSSLNREPQLLDAFIKLENVKEK